MIRIIEYGLGDLSSIEIGSLPGSDEGVITTDRNLQFLVDEMVSGDFMLRMSPGQSFIGDDKATEAILEFSLQRGAWSFREISAKSRIG